MLRVCIITFEISLHACSLAKCVEVGLFDVENKGSNFFNMTFKTITTFEFSLYAYAPINVKPQGGEAGYRRGI